MFTFKFKRVQKVKVADDIKASECQALTVDAPEQMQLISDIGRTESELLISNNTVLKSPKIAPRASWLYLTAILVAYACAHGAANLSRLGMDWGYFAVEHFIGQPSNNDQWMGAGYLEMLVAPAIYLAMAISILKGALGGTRRRQLLLLPLGIVVYLGSFFPPDFSSSLNDCLAMSPYVIGVFLVVSYLSLLFDLLYRELAQRTNARRLLTSSLIAVLPAALLPISSDGLAGSHNVLRELALYCGLLFASGFCAPVSIRASNQPAALSAVFFASLPIIIFNLINVVFATVCGIAGHAIGLNLGWTALVSALLISFATFIVITSGAACGCIATRLYRKTRFILEI